MEGAGRLLATGENSAVEARETVKNRSISAGDRERLLTTAETGLEGPERLLTTGATVLKGHVGC